MASKETPEVTSKTTGVSSADISLEVTAHPLENQENLFMVSVKPEDCDTRPPCDICCVVDVSCSMDTEAKTKNDKGDVESHGLTLLDIVKHAVKTVVMSLEGKDRMSLIVYDTNPEKIFGLTKMDKSGKESALKRISGLQSKSRTNLWGGLAMGLDVMKEESRKEANRSLFLLTDGLPNVVPPRGHIPMLRRYKDEYGLSCSIGTFGFGYELDSQLLHDIAMEGQGMYTFIPDSSFVGTSFVNAVSNALSTISRNVELSIETLNGTTIITDGEKGEQIGGGHLCNITTWGAQVSMGALLFGQERNIVFRVHIPNEVTDNVLTVTVTFIYYNERSSKLTAEAKQVNHISLSVDVHRLRTAVVIAIQQAIDIADVDINLSQKIVRELQNRISTSGIKNEKYIIDLLKDLSDQITEALSRQDWYARWGKHYLLSLKRAHLLQQCSNFKDPGLQHYGGKLFNRVRDVADDIFIKIPPPEPKIRPTTTLSAPLISMSRYHNCAGPCFSGESLVLLPDDTQKRVDQLARGDFIKTPTSRCQITCVIKTHCSKGRIDLVNLHGLGITPWHPVRIEGKWTYPCKLSEPAEIDCVAVYSFVLETSDEEIMIINNMECATLGHSFTGDVIGHPYFGSNKVREDIRRMKGWNTGLVELSDTNCLVKDATSGLVSSLYQI
eukprot:TRINITY_DN1319_c1_g4_i1.p1 TRINITY_DN1319_c1_g4~~TRINITY_DN1319_c1_g4_i1.p1  ORF type:complete len:684 (+),score=88.35 TRINITY_DN1319_c1_g4_i1:50-2053(+)